jgi:hypothetical protein
LLKKSFLFTNGPLSGLIYKRHVYGNEGIGSMDTARKCLRKGALNMEKRKWKTVSWVTALTIMLSLALSAGWAQEQEKEKKGKWKSIFKRKTEEKAEAEVLEEAAGAAGEELFVEEPSEEIPAMEEPAAEDWWKEEGPSLMEPTIAAPMPSAPPAQEVIRLHRVGEGENLHLLAAYYYGDARTWPKIYNLNKKEIRNPNLIRVGQIIKIKVEPGWKPRFSLSEFMENEKDRRAAMEQQKMEKPIITKEVQTIIPTIRPLRELEEEEEETERRSVPLGTGVPEAE